MYVRVTLPLRSRTPSTTKPDTLLPSTTTKILEKRLTSYPPLGGGMRYTHCYSWHKWTVGMCKLPHLTLLSCLQTLQPHRYIRLHPSHLPTIYFTQSAFLTPVSFSFVHLFSTLSSLLCLPTSKTMFSPSRCSAPRIRWSLSPTKQL